MIWTSYNPLYSIAGFLVGMLVGLTGVGGGSLMTPLLVLLFNFHPATAVGTDLLYASVTKTVGTFVHGKQSTVNWRIVGRLALGSLPAAAITILMLATFGSLNKHTSDVLGELLGASLILTSVSIFLRPQILAWAEPRMRGFSDSTIARLTVLTGIILGVLVSITSVGAGALGVTALLMLYPRLPMARIAGSDIAHAVPLTLLAGLGHLWIAPIDFNLLFALLIGSIPGIIIGSLLGTRASDSVLRPILAATLLIVGVRLLLV